MRIECLPFAIRSMTSCPSCSSPAVWPSRTTRRRIQIGQHPHGLRLRNQSQIDIDRTTWRHSNAGCTRIESVQHRRYLIVSWSEIHPAIRLAFGLAIHLDRGPGGRVSMSTGTVPDGALPSVAVVVVVAAFGAAGILRLRAIWTRTTKMMSQAVTPRAAPVISVRRKSSGLSRNRWG